MQHESFRLWRTKASCPYSVTVALWGSLLILGLYGTRLLAEDRALRHGRSSFAALHRMTELRPSDKEEVSVPSLALSPWEYFYALFFSFASVFDGRSLC